MTILLLAAERLCQGGLGNKVDSQVVNEIAKDKRLLERFLGLSRD